MTLSEKQRRFTELVGKLILWAYENGFELTFGDAFRSQAQAQANAQAGIGISNSLHTKRLAVDFNLFVEGVYQTASSEYGPLGAYWKSLDPDCRWGGDFASADGNHFSFTHEGVR